MKVPVKHPDMEDCGHAFAATVCRFPDDDMLRSRGYRIHSRAKGQEAVWLSPEGDIVPQSEAMARVCGWYGLVN